MKSFGELAAKINVGMMPKYTLVHHPVREKFELSMAVYAVIDSIDNLSHNANHPWCVEKKEKLASWLGVSRQTIHTAINVGIEKGLLEKNEQGGLRTTETWIANVRLYERAGG